MNHPSKYHTISTRIINFIAYTSEENFLSNPLSSLKMNYVSYELRIIRSKILKALKFRRTVFKNPLKSRTNQPTRVSPSPSSPKIHSQNIKFTNPLKICPPLEQKTTVSPSLQSFLSLPSSSSSSIETTKDHRRISPKGGPQESCNCTSK